MIAAVIFDLDGVLIDSEQIWGYAKEEVTREHGGAWRGDAVTAMLGMSAPEWSHYMHDELCLQLSDAEIVTEVVRCVERLYREHLPLLPGARSALMSLAPRWPMGLASSSNRAVIELVLDLAGFRDLFEVVVSSEEVARGKPSPDVYLEAARRLSAEPAQCAAVEDSTNGLRAAAAAGTRLIAIPNRSFWPDDDALALAAVTLDSLEQLSPEVLDGLPAA